MASEPNHAGLRLWSLARRGLVVVLLGPDGSGKTTLAQQLERQMQPRPFSACRTLRRGMRMLPRRRRIAWAMRRMLGRPLPPAPPRPALDHNGMLPPQSRYAAACRSLYSAVDMFLGWPALWRMRRRRELVLFDRYFYDDYFQRRFQNVPWRVLDVWSLLVPRPDLIIHLDADPEQIHERKPELSIDEIRRQQRAIQRFLSRWPVRSVVVDTRRGHADSGRAARAEIFRAAGVDAANLEPMPSRGSINPHPAAAVPRPNR